MSRAKSNEYIPKPLDTTKTTVPTELLELQEALAKNVHENWSKARMDQGWKYGEERNDRNKTTPCLVPYEDLPESEKFYDRQTALETLRFILANGYDIVKK